MKILIDTNVLVYAFDPADVDRQENAIDILSQLRLNGSGRLSAQCLAEFFSAITRPKSLSPARLSPAKALEVIVQLAAQFETYPVTLPIVLEAGRGVRDHQMAYYDAQIWATARLNQVDAVFTEDIPATYLVEGIQYVNPFLPKTKLFHWL